MSGGMQMADWLRLLAKERGSDLFFSVGAPPALKIEGRMRYIGQAPESFPDEESLLGWFRENYPEMLSGLSEEELRAWAGYSVKPGPAGGFIWRMDPAVRRQSAPPPPAPPADLWALVPAITCPVLVVRGAVSDILAAEVAERFVDELADGRLVTVPGLGHAPTLTEPAAVTALREFLPGGRPATG